MAKEDQVQQENIGYGSLDVVDYPVFLEYSRNEWAQALVNYIECEQKHLSKTKSLKKGIWDLSF